jgi:hypothetical protein
LFPLVIPIRNRLPRITVNPIKKLIISSMLAIIS